MSALTKNIIYSLLIVQLMGCSFLPFVGDDEEVVIELRKPAELEDFAEQVEVDRLWNVSSVGANDEGNAARLRPILLEKQIAFVTDKGAVGMLEATTGKSVWKRSLAENLSGGVGGNTEVLVVGDREGKVYGVSAVDGVELWQATVSSEVVAVSKAYANTVVVRCNDSKVYAIDVQSGSVLWTYGLTAPALLLRGASLPLIDDSSVYVGFDNGRLTELDLNSGDLRWEIRVAIPSGRSELERIVDIDGQMAMDDFAVYAVSFNGRVVAVSKANGRPLWARDMSSIRGLQIDNETVYISDSDSVIWAIEKNSGTVLWKQEDLQYRQASAPAVYYDYIAVGDFEGYVHVLSKQNGSILGRGKIGGPGFAVPPMDTGEVSYFTDTKGRMTSVSLKPVN